MSKNKITIERGGGERERDRDDDDYGEEDRGRTIARHEFLLNALFSGN